MDDDDDYDDFTIKGTQIFRDKLNDTNCSDFKARLEGNIQIQVRG